MRRLRRFARLVLDLVMLPAGALIYTVTGNTPIWAGQSMIRLFCRSGGQSNDMMARLMAWLHPPRDVGSQQGVLPILPNQEIRRIGALLDERGYFVFEERVPSDICARLRNFALEHPSVVRLTDGKVSEKISVVYNPEKPLGVRYDFQEGDLINHPDVQALVADPSIVAAAQAYLGAEPVVDVVAMWWNTAFSDKPDSEAAQFYHFDMDRIKWVKFFIYLTDVVPESGPHYFIAGSHRTGGISLELLAKGYARLSDEEVARYYRPQDFIEFSAPCGTVIAEDTRGLHKGQHVRRGHRLVLQIQFSVSLFGPAYPKVSFDALRDPRLAAMARSHPRIYSSYMPGNLS